MYEDFGAIVAGQSVEFRVFFPDAAKDPSQYDTNSSRGTNGLPRIAKIRVSGNFQSKLGGQDWDFNAAPELMLVDHPHGILYTFNIDSLPDGFYQYSRIKSLSKAGTFDYDSAMRVALVS